VSIRRLTHDDAELVVSTLLKHKKFQNLPKAAIMSSIHDHDTSGTLLFDRSMKTILPEDLKNPNTYCLGNFSNDDIFLGYYRFKLWTDPDTNELNWTQSLRCKNLDAPKHYFTYNISDVMPDQFFELSNYFIDFAESLKIKTGYGLTPNAVSSVEHPNGWIVLNPDTVGIVAPDPKLFRLCSSRYKTETVELIPAGEYSAIEKYRNNVHGLRFSVAQKISKYTRIDNDQLYDTKTI